MHVFKLDTFFESKHINNVFLWILDCGYALDDVKDFLSAHEGFSDAWKNGDQLGKCHHAHERCLRGRHDKLNVDFVASTWLDHILLDQNAADIVRVAEEAKHRAHKEPHHSSQRLRSLDSLVLGSVRNPVELLTSQFFAVKGDHKLKRRQSLLGVTT